MPQRSLTLPVTVLVAALAAVTLAGPLAGPASAGERAPRTDLHPRTADRGANPRVAYYDRRSHTLHEGRHSVRVRFPGLLTQLADVRRGWVLVNQQSDPAATTTFRFVNTLGRSRVLARTSYGHLDAVSADGTRVAFAGAGARRTTVLRVSDGKRATHSFHGGGRVVALGHTRALVNAGAHTVWWTPRTGLVTRYSRDQAYAADTTARRVAMLLGEGPRSYVGSFPRGSRPRWVLPDGERVGRFSVDDRHVLTLGHRRDDPGGPGYSLLRSRSTRDGLEKRTFVGELDPAQDPRWEDPTTFLALVRRPRAHHGTVEEAWLRCTTKGRCERASMVFALRDGRQAPVVLALQRTG